MSNKKERYEFYIMPYEEPVLNAHMFILEKVYDRTDCTVSLKLAVGESEFIAFEYKNSELNSELDSDVDRLKRSALASIIELQDSEVGRQYASANAPNYYITEEHEGGYGYKFSIVDRDKVTCELWNSECRYKFKMSFQDLDLFCKVITVK